MIMRVGGIGGRSLALVGILSIRHRYTAYIIVGDSLQSKLESAIEMSSTHRQAFVAHNATFEPETVAKWETLVNEWEKDSRKPNPYEQPEASEYAS